MNKVHRIIWNQALQIWMVVAENAKSHSKSVRSITSARRKLNLAALLAGAVISLAIWQTAQAAPAGGQVVSGTGSIAQSGQTTTIKQSTQNLSLQWNSFNVGTGETVNFVQPSATALAVNKIVDTHGSQILGNLNANGQVFLINPNGVIFGAGAQVNVGGLVASTLDLASNSSSGTGSVMRFAANNSTGSVINLGKITASEGGYVALLGNHVSNQGVISAQMGAVALGAGSAVTLSLNGSHLLRMVVDQSVINTLADNGGLIRADGGSVLMTAGAAKSLLASVVNNTGVIEARTVNQQGGTITLLGGMQNGTVKVAGTLDASAPNGANGGFIETSAARVKVANDAKVTTAAAAGQAGTWLIDPTDFTVAASGGDITGATLSRQLGDGNITIASSAGATGTAGNVYVNDAVTWNANKLTLNALNDIHINANLNGSCTASLALEYGQGSVAAGNASSYRLNNGAQVSLPAGPNFSTLLGSDGVLTSYTVINNLGAEGSTTATDLQGIRGGLSGNFVLGSDIDASPTSAWNAGAGFTPIGDRGAGAFAGKFDGLGHTIVGLKINLPSQYEVGLFGLTTSGALIQNVGLVDASVHGQASSGSLVGDNSGTINNSYAIGYVTGRLGTGGLVGYNGGTINNSYAIGTVTGLVGAGGLAGYNGGTINDSYARGSVTGYRDIGGLAGDSLGGLVGGSFGTIRNSHATADVSGISDSNGTSKVGGLVGNNSGTISSSYATGHVIGFSSVGGLLGTSSGGIHSSYATGNVSGYASVGGLFGTNSGLINKSYATGNASGNIYVGGLGGIGGGYISNSYATGNVIGTSGSWAVGGLLGRSSGSINNSYATGIVNGDNAVGGLVGYVTWINASITSSFWDTTKNPSLPGVGSEDFWGGPGNDPVLGDLSGVNGLTSSQMMQASSFAGWSISKTGGSGSVWRIYEGHTAPLLKIFLTPLTLSDAPDLAVTYNAAFQSGGVTASSLVLGSAATGRHAGFYNGYYSSQQGYDITGGNLTILAKALTITGSKASNKVYDASTAATLTGGVLNGVLGSDSVSLVQFGNFATKNAGTCIAVTAANSLGGPAASDYFIATQPTGLRASIKPKLITVAAIGTNKVYDGTVNDAVTLFSSGVVAGDSIAFGEKSASFANPNVGNGKRVTVSGITITGADSGNYLLASTRVRTTANITPATLTVLGQTAADKAYDGTTTAKLTGGTLVGVIAGDKLKLKESGYFVSPNVGSSIPVIATDTVTGGPSKNYTLVQPTGLTANITP